MWCLRPGWFPRKVRCGHRVTCWRSRCQVAPVVVGACRPAGVVEERPHPCLMNIILKRVVCISRVEYFPNSDYINLKLSHLYRKGSVSHQYLQCLPKVYLKWPVTVDRFSQVLPRIFCVKCTVWLLIYVGLTKFPWPLSTFPESISIHLYITILPLAKLSC